MVMVAVQLYGMESLVWLVMHVCVLVLVSHQKNKLVALVELCVSVRERERYTHTVHTGQLV